MFDSPVLDLIILLSFTYFIGSLILSSVNEFIAAIFRLRQKQLKSALENLFPADQWKTFVQGTLIKSPHIQALMKSADKYPVYIPAKNFVSALIHQVGSANFNINGDILPTAITNSLLPDEIKQVMLDLLAKAQNNLDGFQKELEMFYNDAMDRAGGWYKRYIRTILLILGGATAIALNIDTIKIVQDSLQNTDNLSKTVDNITTQMSKVHIVNDSFVIEDKGVSQLVKVSSKIGTNNLVQDTAKIDSTQIDNSSQPAVSTMKKDQQNIKNLQVIYQQNTGYNLGYTGKGEFKREWVPNGLFGDWTFWKKLLGILITVFALQLGSNYWFDTLNKVINIRAAGKKPDDNKNK